MKIAIWHNLPSGGGKRALYYHVKGLLQRGHHVESWCLSTADSSYLPLKEIVLEHVVPFNWEPKYHSGKAGLLFNQYRNALDHLKVYDEACKQCAKQIAQGNFDLLMANSSTLYYMPFILRHVKIPKVLYLQEPFRPLYEANPTLPWIGNVYDNFSPRYYQLRSQFRRLRDDFLPLQALRVQAREEWLNAHACDTLLVNSYYSRESVLRAYGRDAQVCYLGIDTTLFRNLHLEREHFIVGLGSFDKIKGVDLAVRSVALLSEAQRPALVWIANSGEPHYIKEMDQLAQRLGVDLRVKMRVSDLELIDTLNRAKILLYTSHLEPFGFAPLEANACGTPAVAVAEGGVRETVKNGVNGFLVDRDPESISSAIKRLLDDSELARRMGEDAALYVQQEWSVERSIDRLELRLIQTMSKLNNQSES